jgi:hypothetical protein
MQIPETPTSIAELDMMKRLAAYGDGTSSFLPESRPLGEVTRQACKELHAMLASLERTASESTREAWRSRNRGAFSSLANR